MRIGLYGISGVYNFGCEAIVRGAYEVIRRLYPGDGTKIVYFSYSPEYDQSMLSDLDIKIFPIKTNKNFFKRVIRKGLQVIGSEKRPLLINFNEMMDEVDCIWSIGGDIYTIPAVLRKEKRYPYFNDLINFCDAAIGEGKDIIVYGASIGPFGDYRKAINYYRNHLSKYKKIICREYTTINYLESIGVHNTMFLPDPAFQIQDYSNDEPKKKYIGINLSPLSLIETYGNYNEENIKNLSRVLDKVFAKFGIDLILIPHVISKDKNDDDLRFLTAIKDNMAPEVKDHVSIADYSNGFLGVKKQLRECYFVLSARMHCAINAIDENVPTIFVSYSQKSVGMCEYIYNSDKWLLNLKDIETQGMAKMVEMMENRNTISKELVQRNKEIECYFKEHYAEINE